MVDVTDEELLGGSQEPRPLPEHGYDLLNRVSDAPTVYADGCIFVSKLGDAIRISFVETILEPANGPQPGIKTRHVMNVVMSAQAYANTLTYMNNVVHHWAQIEAEAAERAGAGNGDEPVN